MRLRVPQKKLIQAATWSAAGLAGLFFAINVATSFYVEWMMARPKRKRNRTSDLSDFVPEVKYETSLCRFTCDDGVEVSALVLTPEKINGHIILICHGLSHDKQSGIRFVQYLLREGYTLLSIDFRNHGESQGDYTTYGYHEKKDLVAAIRYLRQRCGYDARIGVLGASMGASIALQAAAETGEISGLVLDSPFASLKTITYEWADQMTHLPRFLLHVPMNLGFFWYERGTHCRVPEVEPVAKVKNIQCPIFLIHGSDDTKIPAHHSQDIFDRATGDKEIWIAEGVGHLGTYLRYRHEYEDRVLKFFKRTLLDADRTLRANTAS